MRTLKVNGISLSSIPKPMPSPTLEINERSKSLIESGKDVYRFGFGQSPFPVPDSVVAALQKHAAEKDYLPVKGLPKLREVVASFHQQQLGFQVDSNQVLIGPGSKELIFLLQLAYPSILLVPNPSWVSYVPQAKIQKKEFAWIDTHLSDNWMLKAEALKATCLKYPDQSKLLILNGPNNPTGYSPNSSELKALADVAREYQVLILSDEIYGQLDFATPHQSIAQYYPEGTIVSGGLSKWCGAGGWRLGNMVFPKELLPLLDYTASIGSETFSAVSAPIQHAAITAYTDTPELRNYLDRVNKILHAISHYSYDKLSAGGLRIAKPGGGFYLFPSFEFFRKQLNAKDIHTSKELCNKLLEEIGVALLPGSSFGRPENEFTTRLSYVDFDGAKALVAANSVIDQKFIEAHFPRVLKGINKLVSWLAQL